MPTQTEVAPVVGAPLTPFNCPSCSPLFDELDCNKLDAYDTLDTLKKFSRKLRSSVPDQDFYDDAFLADGQRLALERAGKLAAVRYTESKLDAVEQTCPCWKTSLFGEIAS